MNTLNLIFVTGICLSGALSSYAQNVSTDGNSSNEIVFNRPKAEATGGSKPTYNAPNLRAGKNFEKEYKDVTTPVWEAGKNCYSATFTRDNIRHMVVYSTKGHWLHSILTYNEKQLPKAERAMVKSVYFDHDITSVREIRDSRVRYPIYLITIEDEKEAKVIRVAEGEWQIFQEFKKR